MTLTVQSKPDHLKSRGSGPVYSNNVVTEMSSAWISTDVTNLIYIAVESNLPHAQNFKACMHDLV